MEYQTEATDHRVVVIAIDESPHSDNAVNSPRTDKLVLPDDLGPVKRICVFESLRPGYLNHIMKEGDSVVLIHVPEMFDVADATDPEQVRGCMQAKQRKMFNLEKKYMDLLQAKHAHLKSKFRTHGGKPGEFICKAAEEEGAELVICGTRGQGTIRRTFLGSVSNYLVHHSHVPVLVCRQTH